MRGFRASLLAAAVLAVSACTGPVDVRASDSAQQTAPLSAVELQLEGNRICRNLTAELAVIRDAGTGDDGFLTAEARAQINEARETGFDELFALQPPPESADAFSRLKAVREEWVASSNARIPEPDADLRLGPQWDELIAELQLSDCG